jgi:hypothetical protein
MGNQTSKQRTNPTKDDLELPPEPATFQRGSLLARLENVEKLPPGPVTFQSGSLLARLDKGESYESIKSRGPLTKDSRRGRRTRKEKSKKPVKKPVELPARDQVLTPNHELDSNMRIELPRTISKDGWLKEESSLWLDSLKRKKQGRKRGATELEDTARAVELEDTSRAELDGVVLVELEDTSLRARN